MWEEQADSLDWGVRIAPEDEADLGHFHQRPLLLWCAASADGLVCITGGMPARSMARMRRLPRRCESRACVRCSWTKMATCLSAQMVLPRAVSATSVSQLCAPSPCCLESVPFMISRNLQSSYWCCMLSCPDFSDIAACRETCIASGISVCQQSLLAP